MQTDIEQAIVAASEQWKAAFNAGNATACAACYEDDAIMVATPFGEYRGRPAIQAFWAKLIESGYRNVAYTDTLIEPIDERRGVLTARWSMDGAHGVITRELWVIQSDGTVRLREDHFEAAA